MFGVVIWSDSDEGKAVIWCEDHGDLAFYRQETFNHILEMDPGDLVQFDLKLERSQRIACNPRLVAEGVYDGLCGQLSSARPAEMPHLAPSDTSLRTSESKVIAFDQYRERERPGEQQLDVPSPRHGNGS